MATTSKEIIMLNMIKKIALSTIGIVVLSAPALAERNNTPDYMAEIDSCIVEFNSRIDTNDAERLRHIVTKSRRSGNRYAFNIKTTVFTAEGESYYSVYCVARGNSAPIAFKLKERKS
jgi:hypothetical protein